MTATAPALLARRDPRRCACCVNTMPSRFVLTADHAGRLVPRRLGDLGVTEADLGRHIAWDIGIAGVTERLAAALDATSALQTYSRLVIDCNRDPSWPSAIPVISEFTDIPGNQGLTDTDRIARISGIFRPYHDRIWRVCSMRVRAGEPPNCAGRDAQFHSRT